MKKLTPIPAIKKYCKEQCCANDFKSWKECSAINCYLWLFRLGKRPTPKTIQQQKQHPKYIANPSYFERNTYHDKGDEEK